MAVLGSPAHSEDDMATQPTAPTQLEQSFADLTAKHGLASLTINFHAVRDDGGEPFFAVYPHWLSGEHEQGIGPTVARALDDAYLGRAQRKLALAIEARAVEA